MLPKPAKRPKWVTNHFKCCLFYRQPDFTACKWPTRCLPAWKLQDDRNRTKIEQNFYGDRKIVPGISEMACEKPFLEHFRVGNRTKFLKHLLKPENWLQKVLYHLLARIASRRKHPVKVPCRIRFLDLGICEILGISRCAFLHYIGHVDLTRFQA